MPSLEIAAYYFPQWHTDPRNALWHGKGWTEWEILQAAQPRFEGHRQPIVPAWGYFDEADPVWAAREIDLAADHGITCFLYDWYWYEDTPFLQRALDEGFLAAFNNTRLKFALMWANHDWMNLYPAPPAGPPQRLMPGAVSVDSFSRMTEHIVEHYFSRSNYLKRDGAPYFSIYDLGQLMEGLGGWEATKQALTVFRQKAKAAGFPDVHLNAMASDVARTVGSSEGRYDIPQMVRELGLSSVTSYCWLHHHNVDADGFPVSRYEGSAEANYVTWENCHRTFSVPYFPNVSMGWDSSPRTVQNELYKPHGYPWTAVWTNNHPAAFQEALERAKAYTARAEAAHRLGGQGMITINAWNEWTEGSYLLPDTVNGNAYLEAIRSVFGVQG